MCLGTKNNSLFRRSDEQKILRAEEKKRENEKRKETGFSLFLFINFFLCSRYFLGKI